MNEETVLEIFDRYIPFDEMDTQTNGIAHVIKMFPDKKYIIASTDHDIIYFNVSFEELCELATEEDIIFLRKCGFSIDCETLSMYV